MDRLRGWARPMGMDDVNVSLSLVMSFLKARWAMVEACLSLGKGLVLAECLRVTKWEHRVGWVCGQNDMHDWGGTTCDEGMGKQGAK